MDPESKKLLQQLYARPRDPAALQAVRVHFAEQRRFKGLAKVLEWWSDKAPTPNAAAEALFEAAESLERGRGEANKVIELLEHAVQKDPKHGAASLRLEQIYRERGDEQKLQELMARTGTRHISLIDELEGMDESEDAGPSARPSWRHPSAGPRSSPLPPAPSRPSQRPPGSSGHPSAKPSAPTPAAAPRATSRSPIAPAAPGAARPALPRIPPPPALPNLALGPQPGRDSRLKEEPATRADFFSETTATPGPSAPLPAPLARPVSANALLESPAAAVPGPAVAGAPPPVLGLPPDGFEPRLSDDEEDGEAAFREPFGLDRIIDDRLDTAFADEVARPAEDPSTSPVLEVIRIHQGRALGVRSLRGPTARIIGYRERNAPFSLRLRNRGAVLKLREPVQGWVRPAKQPPGMLPARAGDLELGVGDSAEISHQGVDYRVNVYRPPAVAPLALKERREPLARRGKLYAICLAIALGVHALALLSIALLQNLGVTFKVEDRPQEEIFAEIRTKPPEERPKKPKPPPRIQRRKPPKPKELPPPDRPAQIPKYLRNKLSRLTRLKPGARAERLLSTLTSPVQGEGQTLRDVVTNLDAVRGGEKAGAFALGGTLAHLDGVGKVNIASGGGGELGTLGGEEATKGVKRLEASKGRGGKVRGRVRAMSVGSRVTGSLSRGQVMAVINRHMARIQQCYERGLTRNPTLSGMVSFTWEIKSTGRVSKLRQNSSTLGDIGVSNCISAVINRMKFPSPKGGSVSITFPFIFRRAQ